jgi:hypothetical protein
MKFDYVHTVYTVDGKARLGSSGCYGSTAVDAEAASKYAIERGKQFSKFYQFPVLIKTQINFEHKHNVR